MAVRVEAIFQYSAWATERLIEACEALPPEQLDVPAEATAGTLRETLTHIVAAEQRYIERLGGPELELRVAEGTHFDLDVLKRAAAQNGEALASMATSAPPDWRLAGVTEYGLAFDTEGVVFLLQAINHGASHRQQVVSWLAGRGLASKDLDEQIDPWSWGVTTGLLRTDTP